MISLSDKLKGKRIAGIDFGLKRVGISVSDELHIVINPLTVLDFTDSKFWEKLLTILLNEKIGGIVVGIPVNISYKESNILPHVRNFIKTLKKKVPFPIFEIDESYTSKVASSIMLEIGKKKSQRRKKGAKDMIASAVILRDFIKENNL